MPLRYNGYAQQGYAQQGYALGGLIRRRRRRVRVRMMSDEPALLPEMSRRRYDAATARMAEALHDIFPAAYPSGSASRRSPNWLTRSCATRRWCCWCRARSPWTLPREFRVSARRYLLPSLPAAPRAVPTGEPRSV